MNKKYKFESYDDMYKHSINGNIWNFDLQKEIDFLKKHTSIEKFEGSLLDVECGDGFFCKILDSFKKSDGTDRFIITGSDNCSQAIIKAQIFHPKHTFICENTLDNENKYDIVFCRAPGMLDVDSNSIEFYNNIKNLVSKTNKYLIFIRSVGEEEKYENYHAIPGKGWNHNKDIIHNIFSNFGEVTTNKIGSILISEIIIPQPYLNSKEEFTLFDKYILNAKNIFEFGCGNSTKYICLKNSSCNICSVESDINFINEITKLPYIKKK